MQFLLTSTEEAIEMAKGIVTAVEHSKDKVG